MKNKKSETRQKDQPAHPGKTSLLALLIKKYGRVKLAIITSIIIIVIDILIYKYLL